MTRPLENFHLVLKTTDPYKGLVPYKSRKVKSSDLLDIVKEI